MKRGNEEKVMGPMFPRLHVNDADKGGPRAPPRNKMALYEQLSIPSQRFNPGVLPLNSNNQGSRSDGNLPFPLHGHPSTPTHQAEMLHGRQSDRANVNLPFEQTNLTRKIGDEDDFSVPEFVQSRMGLGHSKTQIVSDKEKLTPISSPPSGHLVKVKNVAKKDPKQISSPTLNLRREVNASPNQEDAECSVPRFNRLAESDACLQQESRSGSRPNVTGQGDGLVESSRDVEKGTVSRERSVSCSRADPSSPNEPDNDSEYRGDTACISPQMGHVDKSDDVSETSMVDSISGMDISPDDVVGIIGQKHFWTARKAIVNQQRLFAVQVFELHRLIKVQRLIAGSPHLLLEDTAFLGTSTLRGSPAKKLSSEYVVKPLLHVVKRKHEPEEPNNKMECSAENAVGKTSHSSVRNGSQTSNNGPYLGNPQPTPVATDNKANPWCFHQSPGHQLLIPVMSPSEGLVYKPYNGPGYMGAVCGGCGPFGSIPMVGNFVKPTYGVPSSHHQGMGVLSAPPSLGHTYFPPYGMSVTNPAMSTSPVEQMHWFAGPGSHGHTDQSSGGGTNSNLQHQSSCNMPSRKNVTIPHAKKFQPSNDSGLQGSTANSTGDRAPVRTNQNAEGSDALQLLPMVPVIPDGVPQSHDTDQPTRAIKVVPHNPRTATASAARIFQSIQAERKQQDST
ncbi:protein EARLY FLOWERING 3 [Pyrus x bretschneideri]|uniref:protein EARLY FLOWERING 3 n=1 Tax=Pyrus x bretschneideri TaxID=225117 RepID=UPI0020303A53|nr:protein EARLY FLOWERING 3 [Pyrus x bretschneideri]